MVETLCEHDPVKIHEAEQAALMSLDARIRLWDRVHDIITDPDEMVLYSELFLQAGVQG